jgi:hypothetical protein
MMPDPIAVDAPVIEPVAEVDPPAPVTVADLLQTSRQAHSLYHQNLPRMAAVPGVGAQLQPGDAIESARWLKAAAAARAQAELLDPTHSDPSWANDAATHPNQELLVFYLQQLSK